MRLSIIIIMHTERQTKSEIHLGKLNVEMGPRTSTSTSSVPALTGILLNTNCWLQLCATDFLPNQKMLHISWHPSSKQYLANTIH